MDKGKAKNILDDVISEVFGYDNPFPLDEVMYKFCSGLKLPQPVNDSTTDEPTWALTTEYSHFITLENASAKDWSARPQKLESLNDIISAWSDINHITTERQIASTNIAESDSVFNCENVYHSGNLRGCKETLFSESSSGLSHVIAGLRATNCDYCVRVEDSDHCAKCFSVIWSAGIKNSFFIQDCKDLEDCIFCSHISGKRFCIANVQLDKEEYGRLKDEVIQWVLTS